MLLSFPMNFYCPYSTNNDAEYDFLINDQLYLLKGIFLWLGIVALILELSCLSINFYWPSEAAGLFENVREVLEDKLTRETYLKLLSKKHVPSLKLEAPANAFFLQLTIFTKKFNHWCLIGSYLHLYSR